MHIEKLRISGFRNLEDAEFVLKKSVNHFSGRNGQGKTNLAEAVYLLFNGRSFRKSQRDEYIRYDRKAADLRAYISNSTSIEIKTLIDKNKKSVLLNDKPIRSIKKELETGCFIFNSDTLFYFKNFSSYRLRFLDHLCLNLSGQEFINNYKKMTKAQIAMRHELPGTPGFKAWEKIFKQYHGIIHDFRVKCFESIRTEYEIIRDKIQLFEIMINLKGGDKNGLIITRKNRRDLSLGETKAVLFSFLVAMINKRSKNNNILLVDDFNSEWDNIMFKKASDVLRTAACQSFIMCAGEPTEETDYIIEKGVISSIWVNSKKSTTPAV